MGGSMKGRSIRGGVLACIAILAVGCGSPTDSNPLAGTFVLRTIAGEALPALAWETEYTAIHIIADTLLIPPRGRAEERRTAEVHSSVPHHSQKVHTTSSEIGIRLAAGRLELSYVCPPNANCVAGPHLIGRLTDVGLTFETASGMRVPLVYERIR
jgi:hypothetical protein